MQSKTSFSDLFSPALFRKNLTRFIPLWGWYLAILLVALPLVLLFSGLSSEIPYTKLDTMAFLYAMMTQFGPILTAGIGICSAMAVFSYLFSARSIGMVHALPIRRSGLFLTNYLSGLLLPIAAHTITAILLLLVQAVLGVFSFVPVLVLWLCLNGMTLFFYSFAVFCAMFTGQILALPVFYAILNVLSTGLCMLLSMLISRFQFGLSNFYLDGNAFSPIVTLLSRFRSWSENDCVELGNLSGYSVTDCQLYGWKWVLIYAIVGIAFAALAYLVYRRRASETAGDLITVRWAAVLFRFGVGLCAALTLGFFIYSLFYYEILADHRHDSMVALTFCMMLMGLVGYFSAEMLLKKTIHVLRTGWRGAIVLLVLTTVVTTCISLDPLDLAGYVPPQNEVQSVSLRTSASNSIESSDPEIVASVVELHQAIVNDKDALLQAENSDTEAVQWIYVDIRYLLTDGKWVSRSYNLSLDEELAARYEAQLQTLYNSDAVLQNEIETLQNMNVSDISFSWENSDWTYVDSQQTMLQIRDAVVEDLRSGNVQLYSLLTGTEDTIGSLDINGWTPGEGDNQNWFYYSYYIPSTATATIAALSQLEAEEIAPGASSAEQTSADYTITEYGTEAKEGDTVLLQWSNAVLQLSNTDSATGTRLLNAALRSDYEALEAQYDAYLENAYSSFETMAANGYSEAFLTNSIARTVSLDRLDEAVLSVRYEDQLFTGGPHGNTVNTCYSYSTDGTRLTLQMISDAPEQLRSFVTDYLLELTQQPAYDGVFFDGYEQMLPDALSDGNWYLTDGGLSIVFDPYEIAPYVAGSQTFVIPYEELDGLIQPQWVL